MGFMTEKTNLYFISILMLLVGGIGLAHVALAHDGEHTAQADVSAETTVEVESSSQSEGGSQNAQGSAEMRANGDVDALDPDVDGDGLSDPDTEAQSSSSQNANANANANAQMKGVDKSTPRMYQGIRMSGTLCGSDADCNDEDDDVHPGDHALEVRVSGDEVRGMSAEAKQNVRARLEAANERNSANDFGISVAQAAIENEDVASIESDDEKTEVRFNTTMRLFGLLPFKTQATARAAAGGEVEIDYPWYSFLARKSDSDVSVFANIASNIRATHDTIVAGE